VLNFAHFAVLFTWLISVNALALDMGTASDPCVSTKKCDSDNVVQALLLTQDMGVYLACVVALFFGFSLGLRIFSK